MNLISPLKITVFILLLLSASSAIYAVKTPGALAKIMTEVISKSGAETLETLIISGDAMIGVVRNVLTFIKSGKSSQTHTPDLEQKFTVLQRDINKINVNERKKIRASLVEAQRKAKKDGVELTSMRFGN